MGGAKESQHTVVLCQGKQTYSCLCQGKPTYSCLVLAKANIQLSSAKCVGTYSTVRVKCVGTYSIVRVRFSANALVR